MTEHRKWRIGTTEPNRYSYQVFRPSGELYAEYRKVGDARAVVAAMNGAGVPVAYRVWDGQEWLLCSDPNSHRHSEPLYTAPPADPVAVVERLRAEWDKGSGSYWVGGRDFADEIIRALKEAGHGEARGFAPVSLAPATGLKIEENHFDSAFTPPTEGA